MTDIFSKEKRSEIMSKIKGKDTKVEVRFRKKLSEVIWPMGLRYRKHYKKIPGSPDIAFPKYKLAVFIDGDFWHGWNYLEKRSKLPEFWKKKIERNMERDAKNSKDLKKIGWKTIRLWEHELKKNPEKSVGKIVSFINKKK